MTRAVISWAFLFVACTTVPAAPAEPWAVGDSVESGWRVSGLQRHAEFLRVTLTGDAGETRVEIVAGRGPSDPWSTAHHRVQPAPNATPPEDLLRAMHGALARWEQAAPDARLVGAATRVAAAPFRGVPAWAGALALVTLLGLACCLISLGRSDRRVRRVLVWLLPAWALLAVFAWHVSPEDLPVDWITPLQAGLGRWSIEGLYARGVHAGPLFLAWTAALARGAAPTLVEVVHANLTLSLAALASFAAFTRVATDSRLGTVVLVAAAALSAPLALAARAETPAALLACAWLAAATAAAAFARAPTRRARLVPWLTLAAVSVAAALVRRELALPALFAVAAASLRWGVGDAALEVGGRRARAWLASSWGGRAALVLLVGLVVGGGLGLDALNSSARFGPLEWALDGVNPLDATTLTAPLALALVLPLGVVALALVGVARDLVQPLSRFGMGIGVAFLVKTYASASTRDALVLARLIAPALPALLLMAALAWRPTAHRLRQVAGQGRARRVGVGVALLAGLLPGSFVGVASLAPWPAWTEALPLPALSLDRNQQREARALLSWTRADPACVVVTRVVAADTARVAPLPWQWTAFGGTLAATRTLPWEPGEDPAAVARQVAPDAPCARLYCGLDTSLVGADGCPEARGRPRLHQSRFASRPSMPAGTFGAHRPEIALSWTRLW